MLQDPPTSTLWFELASLVRKSDPGTYARGLELYRSQRVLELNIDPLPDYWLVYGDVQGSQRQPYELSIEVRLDKQGHLLDWDSDCTCPVGYQCKHGVALMIKAAYQGRRLLQGRGTPAPAPQPPTPEQVESQRLAALAHAQERTRLEAEAQVLAWLKELERMGSTAMAAARAPRSVSAQSADQFLYLLSISTAKGASPALHLEAVTSHPKLAGGWAKPKALKYRPERGSPSFDAASETDHDVLQIMRALPSSVSSYYSSYSYQSKVTLQGNLGITALQKAASTGRLFAVDSKNQPANPVQWGEPLDVRWEWHEVTAQTSEPSRWALRAKLDAGKAKLCLNNPPLYLDAARGLCGQARVQGLSMGQVAVLLKTPPLQAEALKKHQLALAQQLGAIPLPPVLEAIKTLSGVTPKACLHLRPVPAMDVDTDGLIEAQLQFDYAGHRGWWVGQGTTVLIDDAKGRCLLQRDPEVELEAITSLMDLGLTGIANGTYGIAGEEDQQAWLQWAETDFAPLREAGFEVTLDDALVNWITHVDALAVELRPQERKPGKPGKPGKAGKSAKSAPGDALPTDEASHPSPWFDLSLGMEINGQRHNVLPLLPSLIAAAANSPLHPDTGLPDLPPFVYLPNTLQGPGGGFIRLPTDTLKPWMAALLELVGDRDHDFTGDSLKLSRLDALRTTAALGEGAVWEGALHLRDMVQRLSGRAEMPEVALPKGVQAELRPYQQQGLNWLQFLREHGLAGILADDMGLGKTLQTLAHIQVEKDAGRLTHPALIIAPVSLMGNWRRETERFCPGLRCLVIHGKDRHDVADSMAEHDIVIAPYSLLQRDKERWLEAQWHIVVLDEAQNIKNASTHAAQVVGQLQTRHRLCLSGTPMENHLGEIWSLFHFLMPGFLGSQARFKELFRKPIEKLGDPERLHQLRARITPFMLRRTKALVAHELPPKVETIERVELSGKQADLYETIRLGMEKTVREALNTKGLAKSQITILDALMKLRQVCCDPRLLKLAAAQKVKTSAKLEQLMELLPEMVAEGRRILLFSQFTSMLTLIEAELKKHGIPWVKLTGQSQNRDALITQFTSGAVPVFLISLKAGGVGLNLPQADTVIHYDPWWNPAVENQATDRAHRIGQTQTVFVYKLVAQGTIEERILALQERKAALAEGMYSGATGRKQPLFTEGDLTELLKPLSE
jgi:superfamily II DNA or RNA helicase